MDQKFELDQELVGESIAARIRGYFSGLSVHLIFSAIVLVLLTAAAAGLPAIWVINNRLDQQAWAQVEQGVRASQALYAAGQSKVIDLATLTAQRPTLRDLLSQGKCGDLPVYLRTLRLAAKLDIVIACNCAGNAVDEGGEDLLLDRCEAVEAPGYYNLSGEEGPGVYLLAQSAIIDDGEDLGKVIVGLALDDGFAMEMRDQTGLEYTLIFEGEPVATSFNVSLMSFLEIHHQLAQTTGEAKDTRTIFDVEGEPYYASRFNVGEAGLEGEVALDVGEFSDIRRRLIWSSVVSILGVVIAGSIIGALMARRIGTSFTGLAEAATSFSRGDLDTPVAVGYRIREAKLVARTLDKARVDLGQILNQLRQEKAWNDDLLGSIVEGIATLDDHGRITFFSQGAERITGWSHEQVLNQPCDDFFKPVEDAGLFSELIPSPGQGRRIMVEFAKGQHAVLAITGARLAPSEAGEAEVVFVFRDVSEEEAVHRLLGHFMANVSHEFRTPLSALAASIELLIDQASDLNSDELQVLLNSLHLGIFGLQTLVDNILESASIETGHFRVFPRPTNLTDIFADAVMMMHPLLDKHDQHMVVKMPASFPEVRADPKRTMQVLVNLLSNANKYSPDQSEISIGVSVTGQWARVTVTDQGPGIPPECRERVFRRFSYIEPHSREYHYGAGLGLSVVRAIVEAHGGKVGVDDHPKGGSVFWFTLPVVDGR